MMYSIDKINTPMGKDKIHLASGFKKRWKITQEQLFLVTLQAFQIF